METLPQFEFFPDPLREGVFELSDEVCAACGRAREWMYTGPIYGKGDNEAAVCPWCIADGTASRVLGSFFNDATVYASHGAPSLVPQEELDLVEQRTPGYTTWQGNQWLACCNRVCTYLGEADADDLRGRWAEAVPSALETVSWPEADKADFVDRVRKGGGPCVYVFRCQVCGRLKGYWDGP
jgi:uncharacterized protein